MRVLVIEDNQALAFLLQSILERLGHEVRLARDDTKGYNFYDAFRPDIVITDMMFSGKTGIQMMGLIREQNSQVKTIYMARESDCIESMVEEEKEKYPVAFLKTPFSNQELIGILSEFTPRRQGKN